MNPIPALTLIAILNIDVTRLSFGNIVTIQEDLTAEEKTSIGLAGPLSALVENTLDQMVTT